MPEDQNYSADWWNIRVNNFFTKILNWDQLGTSNIDVLGGPKNEPYGLDSVFAYKINQSAPQQVIIIEAKYRKEMKSISRGELQKWVNRLLEKVEHVPSSQDFHNKFSPDSNAQYHIGLIATWINKQSMFNADSLGEILQQIELPEKNTADFIYVIANDTILKLCAVYDEINRLIHSEKYSDIKFYFPNNSSDIICNDKYMPMEVLFSDLIFYKTRKKQNLKGTGGYHEYDSAICFYFGHIAGKNDLHFIDLAIRDSGLQDAKEIEIYLITPLSTIRSETDNHKRNSELDIIFNNLLIPDNLPVWLGE